jgi:serine/threonine-protein kinase
LSPARRTLVFAKGLKSLVLEPGSRVDRYQLVQALGSGSSGTVYEAFDTAERRRVALKVRDVREDAGPGEARFLREARAARNVSHVNVVRVFDHGVAGSLAFLAMELVDGETLAHLLRREGTLSVEGALAIVVPIAAALTQIHAAGMVHGDIKPANVLVTDLGALCPKLTDFGHTRFAGEAGAEAWAAGTPQYAAPEALHDPGKATERSDQYSLAAVLYECLTGRRPYAGASVSEVLDAMSRASARPPSELTDAVAPWLDSVVLRALRRDPGERFASVEEFAQALEDAVAKASAIIRRRPLPAEMEAGPSGRAPILMGDGVALTTLGDVTLVVWKSPATMPRVLWQFDIVDGIADAMPNGFLAILAILPSSSPPNAETVRENIKRLNRLRSRLRRMATIPLGGGLWMAIVSHVFRAMSLPLGGRFTMSSSLEEGVSLALEKASAETPSAAEILRRLRDLFDALDAPMP